MGAKVVESTDWFVWNKSGGPHMAPWQQPFLHRLVGAWTGYEEHLRRQPGSSAKDKRRLFCDFTMSPKRRRELAEWLDGFENTAELYQECPLLKMVMGEIFLESGREWLEQRPWREGGGPPPGWFGKWLPMMAIWWTGGER